MNTATHIQCGVVNHRINREPLDADSVVFSYSDLKDRIDGREGAFYAGMVTAVTNDEDTTYNGPWYVSYQTPTSYSADRILTKTEVMSYVDDVKQSVEEEVHSVISWGHLA